MARKRNPEPRSPILMDKKEYLKIQRDAYQKRLEQYAKEAQKQIDILQGIVLGCDEMIADLEKEEKKSQEEKPEPQE